MLRVHAEKGLAILITTHDMDDVETLCPRLAIIDHGRKLYDGRLAEIRERFGGERVPLAVLDPAELQILPRASDGQFSLPELPASVHQSRSDGPRFWLNFGKEAPPVHELVAWPGAAID